MTHTVLIIRIYIQEDVQIMKGMGLDTYRFSISWPRLLPSKIIIPLINYFMYV